jgi:Uma2 family endonuclease
MSTEVIKKRFTVDEYYRMAEVGILRPEDRVELIDGEIIQMSPVGHRHMARVNRSNSLFIRAFGEKAVVSPQNPVQLSDWTEPQPDIVVFKPKSDFYESKKPTSRDVLLVLEISDTTLRYDMKIKLPHFAAALIPEVWIQDINGDCLHVFRQPQGNRYVTAMQLKRGDFVHALAFPEIRLSIDDLLGTEK